MDYARYDQILWASHQPSLTLLCVLSAGAKDTSMPQQEIRKVDRPCVVGHSLSVQACLAYMKENISLLHKRTMAMPSQTHNIPICRFNMKHQCT